MYDDHISYFGFLDILERVVELYNNGNINEYTVNIISNTFYISMIDESYGGASVNGIFGKDYYDIGGFFDMLTDIEDEVESDNAQ